MENDKSFQGTLRQRLARKSSLWTFLIVIVVLAILIYSLRKDWDSVVNYPWQIRWERLILMAVMHTLALATMYLAWHLTMLRLLNGSNWRMNLRAYTASILARRIPLPIWYVGSRVALYRADSIPTPIVLTATALEIGLIAITGLICYLILLPWYGYTQQWPWYVPTVLASIPLAIMIFRPSIFIDITNLLLRWFKRPPMPANTRRSDLFIWGALYLATWFLDGLGLYFTVTGLISTPIPVASLIGVSTISALVALATMALPSGFGLKEITMGALLSFWMPLSAGVAISIIYRILQTVIESGWAIIGQQLDRRDEKVTLN